MIVSLRETKTDLMSQIIHNPGTIPDSGLETNSTDITIVFENAYEAYQTKQSALVSLSGGRSRYSYVVHSAPTSMSKSDLRDFVNKMSKTAEFLFVTDLSQDYYSSFGPDWQAFVDVVPT